ncbi:MAG: phosphoribosyl-AMP cyclohydrolase [Methanomicrobiales archaeon]|nr:phosphoribosyl-AMP cyclohydrolase [Methanomicrobiales archaeon]
MDLKYQNGLIPVIVQDAASGAVLMFAWANAEAVSRTEQTGYAHFFSRSRGKLWKKGEESGHVQKIVQILVDCDEDCLLYRVEQTGAACHTGHMTCFFRTIQGREITQPVFDPAKVYANKGK